MVIGAAFGKIVTALVDGIVMPAIGMVTGGASVTDWKYVITPAQLDAAGKEVAAEVAIKYGLFFQTIIDFLLIAFVIFLFLKAYNRLRAAGRRGAGRARRRAAAARDPRFAEDR